MRTAAGQYGLSFVLAALAVALLVPGGFSPLSIETEILVGSAAVVLLSLAALRAITTLPEVAGGVANWRLGPWCLLWGTLAFGLASVTWLSPQTGVAARIQPGSVSVALLLFAMAVAVWTVGYLAGTPQVVTRMARRSVEWLLKGTSPVIGSRALVLYAIGSAARLANVVLLQRFGYVGDQSIAVVQATGYANALYIFSTLAVMAVAAAAYKALTTGRFADKAILVTLVCLEIVVGTLTGMKESFVITLIAVLIPYGIVRGRLSRRLLLAGVVLFLCVVMPFNVAYRQAVRGAAVPLTPVEAVMAVPQVLGEVLTSAAPSDLFATSVDAVLQRVRMIDNIAIITQMTPVPIAYRDPLEIVAAPIVGLIPRAIWQDKPVFATGYQFSQDYYGLPSTMYTSSAITPAGDLYRHGGLIIVGIGMLLVGMGCRLFDRLFQPEKDPRAIFFVLVLLPLVAKSEVDMHGLLLNLPTSILTATIAVQFLCRDKGVT